MTWWHNASTADRLKQIDAGIDLGMTARQVGMACGLGADGADAVHYSANKNGLSFPNAGSGNIRVRQGVKRRGDVGRMKRAYFSGASLSQTPEPSDVFEALGGDA